jgi:hypothetical protein
MSVSGDHNRIELRNVFFSSTLSIFLVCVTKKSLEICISRPFFRVEPTIRRSNFYTDVEDTIHRVEAYYEKYGDDNLYP